VPEYCHQLVQVTLRSFIEAQLNTNINRDARGLLGPEKQVLIDWTALIPSADQTLKNERLPRAREIHFSIVLRNT
jgi:hypothetical protein